MKMRKMIHLLLAACLLFSLAACGSGANQSGGENTNPPGSGEPSGSGEPTLLTIGLVGEPDSLVPYMFTSDKESQVQVQLFPYMLQTDDGRRGARHD